MATDAISKAGVSRAGNLACFVAGGRRHRPPKCCCLRPFKLLLVNAAVAAACAVHTPHLLLPTPLPWALMSPRHSLAALFGAGRPTSAASEGPCPGRLRGGGIRPVARPLPDRPQPPPNRPPPLPDQAPPLPNRARPTAVVPHHPLQLLPHGLRQDARPGAALAEVCLVVLGLPPPCAPPPRLTHLNRSTGMTLRGPRKARPHHLVHAASCGRSSG